MISSEDLGIVGELVEVQLYPAWEGGAWGPLGDFHGGTREKSTGGQRKDGGNVFSARPPESRFVPQRT